MISALFRKTESMLHKHARINRLSSLLKEDKKNIKLLIKKIENNAHFFDYIKNKMQRYNSYMPSKHDFAYTTKGGSIFFPCVTLYTLMRSIKPEIVVETGGTPGKSSAAILKAFHENKNGHLYTLDLPPQTTTDVFTSSSAHRLRPEDDVSCWAIEPSLRARHSLILGDTKQTLPTLLADLKQVDIFIHDSDHSYEHMMFEFKASWDFIKPGGFLLSDDVSTNASFTDFAKMVNKQTFYVGNYGILVK